MTRKKVFLSQMAKRQALSYYLFAALFALIAAGKHFDFFSVSAADTLSITPNISEIEPITATPVKAKISTSYRGSTSARPTIRPAYTISSVVNVDPNLPDIDILGTSPATFRYRSLYYGHSSMAFGAIKKLYPGQIIAVKSASTTSYYRIVSRQVYEKSYLDTRPDYRSQIYNYDQGITLMTCGNGSNNDSTYRLIFFAVAI